MSNFKSKERKSLCEESMLVFVNILKFSSLSIARTLVTTSSDDERPTVANPKRKITNRKTVETKRAIVVPKANLQKSKRSQKPEQLTASRYVMIPDHDPAATPNTTSYRVAKDKTPTVDGQFSDYIKRFHEKTQNDHQNALVEGKAESFIKRFHEKNMNDLNNESMRRNYVLPPPPPRVFK